MALLETIRSPRDLDRLNAEQLARLATEIRDFLVTKVSRTGGHLGPNLGVVELTIALHRVFDSPRDRIVFDTGHQAYVHKMLTGRQEGFDRLKQKGGLSGYPSRAESEHDLVENCHASTSLSYADGLAKAFALRGETGRAVVAVIGDGALTGGMAWEALNNIAGAPDRPVIIVVNDNGRSYAPTIGGLANHLTSLRTSPRYEQVLRTVKESLGRTPLVGAPLYDALHGIKKGLKDALYPQGLFEDLGLKYVGPIDGHSIADVEAALAQARKFGGPVIVHCVTRKGYGYKAAEDDEADNLHSPSAFDPATGRSTASPGATWTHVFGEEMVAVGAERPDVVAITAAMLRPTGLHPFAERFPERTFDVGIAEQHAVTSAAGLAMGGMHPVVALYATFLNRAFDQMLLDVALHGLPVTFVLDRAGITGDDGPSHNGMWDLSLLNVVPGMRIAVPRDGTRLRELFREAVGVTDGPTAVRFPKGALQADIPTIDQVHGVDVLARSGDRDVLIVGIGSMAATAMEVADRLTAQGIGVTVVDPRWIKPVNDALAELAAQHRFVLSIEDNGRVGGFGASLMQALADAGVLTPVRDIAVPQEFPEHAKRAEVLAEAGLSAQQIARDLVESFARLSGSDTQPESSSAQRASDT
jgi:1-deoxy-D-xylulose-5-phosphate synthase